MSKQDKDIENGTVRNWLANLSVYFYKNKYLSLTLLLVILIFGALSYTTLLKREGFPTIDVPITLVRGTYLVNDAQEVDSRAAIPAADAIGGIEGVDSVMTSAHDNFFTAVVFTDDSMSSDEVISRIGAAIDNIASYPEDTNIVIESINPSKYYNTYDSITAVYSSDDSLNTAVLTQSAQTLASSLGENENIGEAMVVEQINAGLNPLTGEPVVQQTSFGRVGIYDENGEFVLHEAVNIGVVAEGEIGTLDLANSIEAELDQANSSGELNGATAMISLDSSQVIESQINSLQSNMLTALLAVAFISFLFISWRASVTTAIFMVTVMAATIGILYLIGYSLNTIVLFALVLALGLFVDDATIITEAIDADKGKRNPEKSIYSAVYKVALASFAGTFTTVLVFTPLLFISGLLGEFIRLLPITVVISLLVSLVLSLTLIPFLSRYTLLSKSSLKRIGKLSFINKGELALGRFFSSLPMLLKKRKKKGFVIATLMVGLSVLSLFVAVNLAKNLDFNIFPPADDSDNIIVTVSYPPNTVIEQAAIIADDVSTTLVEVIEEQNIEQLAYGKSQPPSVRFTEVVVSLTPFRERATTSLQMLADAEAAFEGYEKASIRMEQGDSGPPAEQFPFKMQIFGEDTAETSVFGEEVTAFLDGAVVTMSNGKTANITQVELVYVTDYERIDSQRYIEVKAGYDSSNVSALVDATQKLVEEEYSQSELSAYGLSYEDESVTFDFGQESDNADSFKSVLFIMPIALVLMFLLLSIQFRSVIKPLIIFMAIPFSLFGVFLGLTLTNNPMSFFVAIGLIGLIGIVVNNAILLVDYANQERDKGKDAVEAISIALEERFRPLITTTTITVVALLPLAVYDPFWEPLAVTIMFGLISATLLVIIAFPYYYIMADNLGSWINRQTSKLFRR